MNSPFYIMFVCTGNTCRSPMAEGALRSLLNKKRPGKFEVTSAGTAAAKGFPATLYAIEATRMWDVDISSHQSQPLTSALIKKADLILAMAKEHYKEIVRLDKNAENKTYLLKNFPVAGINGDDVADPIGCSLEMYKKTFIEIGEYLGKCLDEIVKRIDEKVYAE